MARIHPSDGSRDVRRKLSVRSAVHMALRQCRANSILISTATLLMAAPPSFAQESSTDAEAAADAGALAEITVTAQRRSQTVQDIPYNISVMTGAEIANSGATNINDLSRIVNGLVTVDQGPAARSFQNDLTLRGLRTDAPGGGVSATYSPRQTVNSVSTYFGETPLFFPMILADVERVEVLRGPQGTLYGSGAQAGTIRVIPYRPDFSRVEAEFSATGSSTDFSDSLNSNVRAILNMPLSNNLALRVVAGYEHLGGFIDSVNLWQLDANGAPILSVPGNLSSGPVIGSKREDVNSSTQWFGRAALRWQPTDAIDIQLDYLHQKTTQDDPQVVTPFWQGGCMDLSSPDVSAAMTPTCAGRPPSAFYANGGDEYTTAAFFREAYEDTVDLGSIVATIDLGFANLTSATSYFEDESRTTANVIGAAAKLGDGTNYLGYPPYHGYPRISFISDVPATNASFVQELRLTSNGNNRLDYVVGAFYQREERDSPLMIFDYGQNAYNGSIGQPALGDIEAVGNANTVQSDKALFGELTVHMTDAWQVTGGLRFFEDEYSLDSVAELPMCGALCSQDLTNPRGRTVVNTSQKFDDHLVKINTSYDLSADTKVYATYAEGFRRGGTNGLPITGPFASLPQYQSFAPDTAENYEIGVKGSLLQRALRYSVALYRIDLQNFQFNTYSASGYAAVFNGSSARTEGVEFELLAAATDNLTLSLGYTYTGAETTEAVQKDDLVVYALIPDFGGGGPTDTTQFLNLPAGARLPGVPRHTGTLGVDYTVPFAFLAKNDWKLLLHADGAYRSSAPGGIDPTRVFYWTVPSSTVSNARASLSISEHLSFDLFVNNISNETAYSGAAYAQLTSHPYQLRNVARPRTIGLTARYKF